MFQLNSILYFLVFFFSHSLYASSDTKVIDCYSKQFLLVVSSFFKSLIPSGEDKLTGTIINLILYII